MSLTVKAFLYRRSWKEEPIEIRRFSLDQDVSTNYSYLLQKIAQVFPSVPAEDVILSWADAEGDHITISSDEELLEALDQFDGSIFKLYLIKREKPHYFYCQPPSVCAPQCQPLQQPASDDKQEEQMEEGAGTDEQPQSSSQDPSQQQKGPLHVGVICDACNSSIYGIRYKCLVCADFDLCSSCEKKGEHVIHNMVTIKDPQSYSPWGFRTGQQHRGCWRGRGRGHHCRGGRMPPGGPWMHPYFLHHLMGHGGGSLGWCQGQQQSGKSAQEKQAQGKSDKMETEQPTPGEAPTEEDAQLEREQRQSYLQDIGEAVSTFLRPFGVKVDVGVVDEGPPKTSPDASPAPSAPTKVPSGYNGSDQLYPTLDSATTADDSTVPPTQSAGAEPDAVEAAVSQLKGMGFDNEGGWLTELVRAKGGDVGKVLDALHPSQSD